MERDALVDATVFYMKTVCFLPMELFTVLLLRDYQSAKRIVSSPGNVVRHFVGEIARSLRVKFGWVNLSQRYVCRSTVRVSTAGPYATTSRPADHLA